MSSKKICVIGAGVSGLVAVKSCLEEGLNVVCYDMCDSVGGLWNYKDECIEGIGSVMKSTVLNTSKEMTSYSDFPPPKHYPNYMHHSLFCRYLENYAINFRLFPHIRLNTEVIRVQKTEDYPTTGQWKITLKEKTNEMKEVVFDGVMICSGHYSHPNMPKFPGLDIFRGEKLHAHQYRQENEYRGKRVLVVGFGNSSCDIAVELSKVAKEVYLSTRRGVWLLSRMAVGGLPTDIKYKSRFLNYITHYVAPQITNFIAEFKANMRFNHSVFGIKPKHRFFSQHPTINDEIPIRILTGSLTIKDDVHKFTETGVIFSDDCESVCNIDSVIFATGYRIRFQFLEENIIEQTNNQVNLYKYVFPPQLPHPTLAVIGLVQALGALPALTEIQSRWVSRVFKGTCHLPAKSTMIDDIERKRWEINQQYFASDSHTVQVDYIWYLDELSRLIAAKPDFRYMLLSDPELFFSCFFGPMLSYTYRLTGPYQWKGARNAILTAKKRVLAPLKTRHVPEQTPQTSVLENLFRCPIALISLAVIITAIILVFYQT
uniref:Flavin-containing monooxygenase n=1 Tax=Strigamia maritima TaxID=126957 RepID=T1JD35_STRMM